MFLLAYKRTPEKSDLVVCAHHAICDGMSLTYLIRDILQQLAEPDREVEILPEHPLITRDTVPSPPPSNCVARGFIGLFNKLWARKKIRLDGSDLKRLHRVFWEQNQEVSLLAWESSIAEPKALVSRCQQENVTVNTALWTTFLAAQYDVQGDAAPYRSSAGKVTFLMSYNEAIVTSPNAEAIRDTAMAYFTSAVES